MHHPSELEVWLADGPDIEEIVERFEKLEAKKDMWHKEWNLLADRLEKLEADLDSCRKLAHSYIEAYEKLAFADAVIEDYPNEWPEDAEEGRTNVDS